LAYYPAISLQNFNPSPDRQRALFTKTYQIGSYDFINRTAKEIFFPAPLNFRYQCSVSTEVESDMDAITEWFYRNFDIWQEDKALLLNRTTTPEGDIGVVCPYTVEENEIPRTDGYFERTFIFMVKTYVHFKAPITKDFIEKIQINLQTCTFDENGDIDLTAQNSLDTIEELVLLNPFEIIELGE
jgi:hypothetical protein